MTKYLHVIFLLFMKKKIYIYISRSLIAFSSFFKTYKTMASLPTPITPVTSVTPATPTTTAAPVKTEKRKLGKP